MHADDSVSFTILKIRKEKKVRTSRRILLRAHRQLGNTHTKKSHTGKR